MATKKKPTGKAAKKSSKTAKKKPAKKKAAAKPRKGREKLSPAAGTKIRSLLRQVRQIADDDKNGKAGKQRKLNF